MRLALLLLALCVSAFAAGAPPAQSCDSNGVSGTTTMNCSLPATTAIGNSIVCFALTQDTTTTATWSMASEAGWVIPSGFPKRGTTTSLHVAYMLRRTLAQASTATATFSANVSGALKCAEYSGLQAFDTSTSATGTGTAISAGTLTTVAPNEVIVAGGGVKRASVTFTSPYTILKQRAGGSQSELLANLNVTTATTYTPTATASSSGGEEWNYGALAFTTLDTPTTNGWRAARLPQNTSTGNIGANQGFARHTTRAFTSACYGGCPDNTKQYKLSAWAMDANGLPTGTPLETRDCGSDAPGAITQINGIYWRSDTNRLYVGAANYGAGDQSWIIEYNPDNLAAGPLATHAVRTLATEGATWNPVTGTWFVFYVDTNNVDEYSAAWSLVRTHSMPTAPSLQGLQWQALVFDVAPYAAFAYLNPHNQNTDDHVWIYSFDGLDFQYRGQMNQINTAGGGNQSSGTGQGIFLYGDTFYWIDRINTGGGKVTRSDWASLKRTALMFAIP